jgi:hypothetical protein
MFRNMMTPQEAYYKCLNEKRRIQELEDIITNPMWSYYYARNVIKGPFDKSHYIIFNSDWRDDYIDFLKSTDYDMNKICEWLI